MPELPEVETVRSALAREVVTRKIKTVTVNDGRAVRRHKSAKDFRDLLEGRSIKGVDRLGKNIVVALDNGNHLVIHLGMTGQVRRAKNAKEPKPKHTHVDITFTGGEELRFADQRLFGELYVSAPPAEGEEVEISKFARLSIGGDGLSLRRQVPELAHLGIDPFEDQVGWDRFAAVLRSRRVALKSVLTDQDIIAGIGNIYADEILFAAGLMYDRVSESLSTIEIRRLHRTIPEILTEAVKQGGTTLADEMFVNLDGEPGSYQDQLQVHTREGQPCYQCRTPVSKVVFHQRATYFCVKCQG